jgi:hypothetical protein
VLSIALLAAYPTVSPGAVFGDGEPGNGTEDDRRPLAEAGGGAGEPLSWPQSAGTIHCDGQIRGTGLLLDPEISGSQPEGAFIVTAAHVLLDPETGLPFESCAFHFMALGALPGYHAVVDPDWVRAGPFNPRQQRDSASFGRHDWAFAYLPDGWAYQSPVGLWKLAEVEPRLGDDMARFHLLAWARESEQITVTGPCRVVSSAADDLGKGGWPAHLLDDCDSSGGASGGGLLATGADGIYLVGIRSGSHHDPEVYPSGPAPGDRWDVGENTNYARGVDQELLLAFRSLVREVLGQRALHSAR